ncbi:FadR/GntR family transcriptional regulator [Anaerobacillus sp. MEB173]|uniref:FadR/GntR family transcriptional regulator n=1 Tax=Anaerobacillus sp. MEB173 TaxID=3383345 RepID=UPI003F9080CC
MFNTFKVDRKSISNTVADYIKGLIDEGKFREGDRLPSEREMAKTLNVSRNTIREAYKILAAMGYLKIKHGNGVFVANYEDNIQNITNNIVIKENKIVELFTIRKVLEVTAIKLAMNRLDDKQIAELKYLLEYKKQALKEKTSYEELSSLDQKFHLTITKISGNTILLKIMMSLIDLLGEARFETLQIPGRVELSLKQHIKILKAMINHDVELAEKYMLEHLDSVEESILSNYKNGGTENAPL